jgi:uncharacterized membrane protein
MNANQDNPSGLLRASPVSPPATHSSHLNVGPAERIASVAAGSLMTYSAVKSPGLWGLLSGLVGGALLWRGTTGYCPINQALDRDTAHGHTHVVEVTRSLTINRPRPEVYRFWRQLENLPRFMHYLEDVRQLGPLRSHWVARLPRGLGHIDWEADIIHEKENQVITWRSQPGSDIDNAGEVRFLDAPDNQGTLVHAFISYRPPAGNVGELAARLLNPSFKDLVSQDLYRLKQLLETGEVPPAPAAIRDTNLRDSGK